MLEFVENTQDHPVWFDFTEIVSQPVMLQLFPLSF